MKKVQRSKRSRKDRHTKYFSVVHKIVSPEFIKFFLSILQRRNQSLQIDQKLKSNVEVNLCRKQNFIKQVMKLNNA